MYTLNMMSFWLTAIQGVSCQARWDNVSIPVQRQDFSQGQKSTYITNVTKARQKPLQAKLLLFRVLSDAMSLNQPSRILNYILYSDFSPNLLLGKGNPRVSPRICHGLAPQTYTLSIKRNLGKIWHYPFLVSLSICGLFPSATIFPLSIHYLSQDQTKNLLWFSHTVPQRTESRTELTITSPFIHSKEGGGIELRKAKDDGTSWWSSG